MQQAPRLVAASAKPNRGEIVAVSRGFLRNYLVPRKLAEEATPARVREVEGLAATHPNFDFHLALSAPLPEDGWTGDTGLIHEVVLENHLREHENPKAIEFYLCGPPMMIKSCTKMLTVLGVSPGQISYDEF